MILTDFLHLALFPSAFEFDQAFAAFAFDLPRVADLVAHGDGSFARRLAALARIDLLAIDADLNAGLVGEDEARKRRATIAQEADFFGSMDGASKFVRGDAIAGIIITIVNIVGGLIIGVFQRGEPVIDAAAAYTLFTVGDGLVTQLPALLIATATGLPGQRAARALAKVRACSAPARLRVTTIASARRSAPSTRCAAPSRCRATSSARAASSCSGRPARARRSRTWR